MFVTIVIIALVIISLFILFLEQNDKDKRIAKTLDAEKAKAEKAINENVGDPNYYKGKIDAYNELKLILKKNPKKNK